MNSLENIAPVAWFGGELTLDYVATSRSLIVDDLISVILVAGISNANTSYLDTRPGLSQAYLAIGSITNDMRRPASVSSLARSLGVPRETARGKMQALAERGLITGSRDGYVLETTAMTQEPILSVARMVMASTTRFLEGLGPLEAFGLSPRWRPRTPLQDYGWGILRLVTAHTLRNLGHSAAVLTDHNMTRAYILLTIAQETGSYFASDKAARTSLMGAGRRFGPVRGATISARLSMPQETVRRQIQTLVKQGHLDAGPDGYTIRTGDTDEAWKNYQTQSLVNTRQLVWKLQAAGLLVED